MKYRRIYMQIISAAKSEQLQGLRKKGNGNYYEAHHILPRSLFPNWTKRKSNIVLLTAREHFFCHQLLTKIFPSKQMAYVLWAFCNRPNADYKITSREYERIKTLRKLEMKGFRNKGTFYKGQEPWNKGKRCPQLAKVGKANGVYQKKVFTNGIINIAAFECPEGFWKGETKNINPETEKLRREKISKATKGKKWYNNGTINKFCFEGQQPEGFHLGMLNQWNRGKAS